MGRFFPERRPAHGRHSSGQAVVELALVLPILVLVLIGASDFARLAGGYVSLQYAVQEGLRQGTLGQDDATIRERVRQAAAGVDAGSITVNITPAGAVRAPGTDLTVEAVYPFRMVAPILRELLGGIFELRIRAMGRVE